MRPLILVGVLYSHRIQHITEPVADTTIFFLFSISIDFVCVCLCLSFLLLRVYLLTHSFSDIHSILRLFALIQRMLVALMISNKKKKMKTKPSWSVKWYRRLPTIVCVFNIINELITWNMTAMQHINYEFQKCENDDLR